MISLAFIVSLSIAECHAATPPNFLLIIADDVTWSDFGYEGNPDVQTPHLDQLRTESMHIRRMFSPAATCSPSRHAIYTGLYSIRSGAYPNHTRLYDGCQSVFQHLQKVGYRTALQNKSHVGPPAAFPYEYIADENDFHSTTEFINRDRTQPWLLVYASSNPHVPYKRGPQDLYDPEKIQVPGYLHDNAETRADLCRYYAEITDLDRQVGKLLQLLDSSQQADKTFVLFVSEQGSSFPYGGKYSLYDNGIRVSALARWPGQIQPGSETFQLLSYVDITPTFVAAAGVDSTTVDVGCPDALGGTGFDGRSFLPLLHGDQQPMHESVYSQHTTVGINGYKEAYPMRAVRDNRYKLINNLAPQNTFHITGIHEQELLGSWQRDAEENPELARKIESLFRRPAVELYDLQADPQELHNLADQPELAEIQQRLQKQLLNWMRQQGDQGLETENLALTRQGKARINKTNETKKKNAKKTK